MRKIKYGLLVLLIATPLFFLAVSTANAELSGSLGRIWHTIVGNPPPPGTEPDPDPDPDPKPPGGDDGLGPGEFRIPWRCWTPYRTNTYGANSLHAAHSAYSLDVNWGSGTADAGHPVYASADGTVILSERFPEGKVVIRHEGLYYTLYVHMKNLKVRKGAKVKAGDKIGEISNTGVTDTHLHINHSKGLPPHLSLTARIQICFKKYKCDRSSVNPGIYGILPTIYNKGCPAYNI